MSREIEGRLGEYVETDWIVDVYDAHARDLYRYLAYMTDAQAAEDLLQETFARAIKARSGFRAQSSAKTWIYAIARRLAVDYLRAGRRARGHQASSLDQEYGRTITALPSWSDRVHDPLTFTLAREELDEIWRVVQRLEPHLREVVIMRLIMGFSGAQSGAALGCSEGHVAVRLHRALRVLRRNLDHTRN